MRRATRGTSDGELGPAGSGLDDRPAQWKPEDGEHHRDHCAEGDEVEVPERADAEGANAEEVIDLPVIPEGPEQPSLHRAGISS